MVEYVSFLSSNKNGAFYENAQHKKIITTNHFKMLTLGRNSNDYSWIFMYLWSTVYVCRCAEDSV